MTKTGLIRRVDELGRIVIPVEIRNIFNIKEKDFVEIFVKDKLIIIKRYGSNCFFCGKTDDLIEFKNKLICKNCIKSIISRH